MKNQSTPSKSGQVSNAERTLREPDGIEPTHLARASHAPDEARTRGHAGDSSSVKWSQERRLQFIDFRLQWERRINRRDVTEFFKISVPQASADISRYVELAPRNIHYDGSSRTYVTTAEFEPVFEATGARQYLSQLLALERQIVSNDQVFLGFRPPVASIPLPSRAIEPGTLALMLRAIAERATLQIRYQSITRDEEQHRDISPHAFGYDGLRWHVRAFCHTRGGFRDFVFGRILSAGPSRTAHVDPAADIEWNTPVNLVLTPDVSLSPKQRKGVEIDHGMKNGAVTITCRQAMLFYTLRALNFEMDGSPRKGERQLVIANLADIKAMLPRFGQA